MIKNPSFLLALLCAAVMGPLPAKAQGDTPYFSGGLLVELQAEDAMHSDDAANEISNIFWRTELSPTFHLNENFSISSLAVLEPVRDLDPGEDGFFDDEGAYIEELKLNYTNGPWAAFAGKFDPGFGIAWDGPGIWTTDFAEDYEMTEKVGFGGSYDFESHGKHRVTASTFFADTSTLSESAFTNRGQTHRSDGGAGNTDDLSSYVLALEGDDALDIKGLSYKVGYRHQAAGDADTDGSAENGMEITVSHSTPVTDSIEITALGEYAGIANFEGGSDDRHYLSASLVTEIDETWNLTIGGTARRTDVSGGDNTNDYLFQITGGYDFGNGFTLDAGWRTAEESDVSTDTIGGLLSYSREF